MNTAGKIDVSCVLITWNSAGYIATALSSAAAALRHAGLSHEFIIVDNGSTDTTCDEIQALADLPTTLIPLGHNTGTTFSRNIALKMARGDYIAVLDSDLKIIDPDTFRTLIAELEADERIGMIAPRLTYGNGKHQKSADVFPNFLTKVKRYLLLKQIEAAEGQDANVQNAGSRDVDYLISAFWLFPHSLLRQIGYLDENIFYAPEDVDYCVRCWLGGKRVVLSGKVVAVHDAQEISRKSLFSKSLLSHLQGLLYFHRKYGNFFSNRTLYARIRDAV